MVNYLQYLVAIPAGLFVLWQFLKSYFPWIPRDIEYLRRLVKCLKMIKQFKSKNITISTKLEENARKSPDQKCVLFEDEVWTYKQMDEWSNRCARAVRSLNILPKDKVGLMMMNEPAFIAIWIGNIRAGAITSFLNFNLRSKALLHCIDVAEIKTLIVGKDKALVDAIVEIDADLKDREIKVLVYGDDHEEYDSFADVVKCQSFDQPDWITGCKFDDPICYIYTSGTTGLPKAVEVNNRKCWGGSCLMTFVQPSLTKNDVVYTSLPLYHSSAALIGVGGALLHGSTMALRKKFSASQCLPDCRKFGVTIVQYIGETLRYVCNQPPHPDDTKHSVRAVIGNGLRPDVWKIFLSRFGSKIHVMEFYAATEGNVAFVNLFNDFGCIGTFTPITSRLGPGRIVKFNTETEEVIRDRSGYAMSVGVNKPGLLIGKVTPQFAISTYKGNKSLTEKKILRDVFKKGDKFFNTGDLLMYNDSYGVSFCDRVGDTFRWKGENVSTNEVSDTIVMLTGIQEANTYGVKIEGCDGRAGMVALVLDEGKELDTKALYDHVCSSLPSYARPIFVRVLTELELTGTFKQRKVALRNEGFDPDVVTTDKFYIIDNKNRDFIPLNTEIMKKISSGMLKL
ncbi:unnamed protein product [Clavelina lepadiformis]|uniref:long-chain-fatty-acid--CoA ligase n=1 Tax=Clavelina lepadiformis TaxID=159417 RepID=A0ABP0GWD5_CLALP